MGRQVPPPAREPPAPPAPPANPATEPAAPAPGTGATNGTAARLITRHQRPNTQPTPGATYPGRTPEELANDLNAQADYAHRQWQAGRGVVGAQGNEEGFFTRGFNNPEHQDYEMFQAFGYHHDLQATDALAQVPPAPGPNATLRQWLEHQRQMAVYNSTNAASAAEGMRVLQNTRNIEEALRAAQRVWAGANFVVRDMY